MMAAAPGFRLPRLLLPRPGIDLRRWAVIACDQYTAQPEYWQQVQQIVGDAPALRSGRITSTSFSNGTSSGVRVEQLARRINPAQEESLTCMFMVTRFYPGNRPPSIAPREKPRAGGYASIARCMHQRG